MVDFGVSSETDTADNLVAGDKKKIPLLVDAAVGTKVRGQVVEFDTTGNNFQAYTSGSAKPAYAVLAEAIAISADTYCLCYVTGSELNKNALDATAQADAEIEAALLGSGIIIRPSVAVE